MSEQPPGTSKHSPCEKAAAIIGASGGIGAAIARRLSEEGYALTLGYLRNEKAASSLAEEIVRDGGQATVCQVDIRDAQSATTFLSGAESVWGRLDSIVMASGPPMPVCPLFDVSNEVFKHILLTEVYGAFNVVKAGREILNRQTASSKSIVFVLSTALQRSLKYDGMSYIPKMAVIGLLKQAVRDYGHEGIRINGIGTGAIAAGMGEDGRLNLKNPYIEYVVKEVSALSGRMGSGAEIATVAAFLLSDAASYVNGQLLAVDGGYAT